MTEHRLPYFDYLLAELAKRNSAIEKSFGRHVHWGYWDDPAKARGDDDDYARAAEQLTVELCRLAGIAEGEKILDVGCGFGGTIASLPTGSATRTTGIRSSWSGKTSTGAWALPGPYMVTLTSASSRGTALPWGSSYAVNAPPPAPPTPGVAVNGDGGYVPVPPHRLLDTRAGVYPSGPGGRIDLHVLGTAGIPASGVTSVYLTLTVTCPTTSGYVTVYAGGTTSPATSNQNFSAGQTRAVLVAAAVGTDGTISIFNAGGTTQVIADVIGYGAASGGDELTAVPLTRVLATYSSPLGQIKTGESRTIALPALAGIPAASIKAVMVKAVVVKALRLRQIVLSRRRLASRS